MEQRLDISFEDLIDVVSEAMIESNKTHFEDLVKLKGDLNREIPIGGIYDGLGKTVERIIHYWNICDDEANIPVAERKPIQLIIDSNGGSLTDALTIVDAISLSKTPVYAFVIGAAYSGGFLITIACHKRYGYKHSSYLLHEGSVSEMSGTSSQFENFNAFYKKQLEQLKSLVLNSTNIDEEYYDRIRKEDIWYDAYEALDKGIIDEII